MNPLTHPLFALGFRPFFSGAVAAGLAMIPLWTLSFAGLINPPPAGVAIVLWHAHEMIYGFVAAVIAGFLLTASQNWTGRRGVHGLPLAGLFALWLLPRGFAIMPEGGLLAYTSADLIFFPALAVALWPYLGARDQRKHWIFFVFFALLFAANLLFHLELHGRIAGWFAASHSLAVHTIVAYLTVIGGRVIPFFTESALSESGVRVRRHPIIESTVLPITLLFAALDFARLMPGDALAALAMGGITPGLRALTVAVALLACAAHALRLSGWRSIASRGRPILWIVHLAYAWIPVGFALNGLNGLMVTDWNLRSVALHAFTAGSMGLFIYGMISRVALGHTGRPIQAAPVVAFGYALMILAALLRVAGPPFLHAWFANPHALYSLLILISGLAWTLAFLILAVVYLPILARPRVDGKPG